VAFVGGLNDVQDTAGKRPKRTARRSVPASFVGSVVQAPGRCRATCDFLRIGKTGFLGPAETAPTPLP
jgi:hypothetical protein